MAHPSTRDMTQGSPTKLIFAFFLPLLLGLVFQQLYNMVDTMIVGRFLGVDALAGVGSTGSLAFLVLGLCTGTCTGFSIPVAQKFGEGDYRGLKKVVANAFMVCVLMAAVVTTVVCLLCRTMLGWMHTPDDIMGYAFSYLIVVFLGIPVVFAYNVLFAVVRSMGDSKTPVKCMVIASITNVVLDLAFILVFHMGVAGAALATVISQILSALLCIRHIVKTQLIIFDREDWKLDWNCAKMLLGMGLPTGLQYSITAIGSIIMQSSVNTLGSVYVASVAAGGKLSMLLNSPYDAMGSTMATYGGQNVGAGKLDRIGRGLRSCSVIGVSYSLMIMLLMLLFRRPLLTLFVDPGETEVLANASRYVMTNVLFYVPLAFVNIVRFLIQGLGFTKHAVIAGVFEMFARALVGMVVVPAFGFAGACFGHPAAWIAADLFLFPTYFWAMRKLRREQAAKLAT